MSSGSNPFFYRDRNAGTVIVSSANMISLVPRWTMQDQFERHYDEIRRIVTGTGGRGYSVIAAYTDGIVSAGQLPAAQPGAPGGVLVVGRHSEAQMQLPADPTVALRHLAIRVVADLGEPEARLIDLNTGQGFQIEGAGHFEGARISGPAFVRIGSYALMLFPRGEVPEIWPVSAEGMFDRLAGARVVEADEEKAGAVLAYSGGASSGDGAMRRDTVITRVGPPVAPKRQRRKGSLPKDTAAVLTASSEYGQTLYPLTAQHLERGVLLGRYDRCEVELDGLWAHESSSRVHLLLLKDGDQFLAIDTASSNGTYVDGEEITVAALADEAALELATGNLVQWQVVRRDAAPAPSISRVEPPPLPRPKSEPELELEPESPFRPVSVVGASAWNPSMGQPHDDEDLPSVLDLLEKRPSPVSSPWPAVIIGAIGFLLFVILGVVAHAPKAEPEPRVCIHPIHDFGTDSPALRLFLQHQDPGVCFQYRWSPWVQDHVDNLREIQRTPPPGSE